MRIVFIVAMLFFSEAAYGITDSCMAKFWQRLPIGEKELVNVAETWPGLVPLPDVARRIAFLRSAGYTDSNGVALGNISVSVVSSCLEADFTLELLYLRGRDGDRDESVYLVTWSRDSVISRSLIAALQTTCESTFLRGCSREANGSIRVLQLQHWFDCDDQDFVRTDELPSFTLIVNADGTFTEVVDPIEE